MPQVIDTPEGWFRKRQKDLYSLTYRWPENADELSESALNKIRKKRQQVCRQLTAWFQANLPSTECQQLGPSEYSGWVCGGPGSTAVDFDPTGLAAFLDAWGDSKSPWQLEQQLFAEWQQQLNAGQLLASPRPKPQSLHWWDTPTGFVFMSMRADGSRFSRYDAAWRLAQLRPDLSAVLAEEYPYGTFNYGNEEQSDYLLIEYGSFRGGPWSGQEYEKNLPRIQQLEAALGLPAKQEIRVVVDD